MTESIRKIKERFTRDGFRYNLMRRENDVVLFEKSRSRRRKTRLRYFEVFLVKVLPVDDHITNILHGDYEFYERLFDYDWLYEFPEPAEMKFNELIK